MTDNKSFWLKEQLITNVLSEVNKIFTDEIEKSYFSRSNQKGRQIVHDIVKNQVDSVLFPITNILIVSSGYFCPVRIAFNKPICVIPNILISNDQEKILTNMWNNLFLEKFDEKFDELYDQI